MATVNDLFPNKLNLLTQLQVKYIVANDVLPRKFCAVILLQRMVRGYLIRKYFLKLHKNALIIQCAFRMHRARKALRKAIRERARQEYMIFYDRKACKIQAVWKGCYSRKKNFCYQSYKRWLKTVKERGEKKAAEAFEYRIRSRVDDLRILENDARQWLAFVVFKLHHLLRTFVRAGVYSNPATNELTEFEKLLKLIHYTEYMKKLRRKYVEFVRKYKPMYNNKMLFPVIGDGSDYWYLSLPEIYELTSDIPNMKNNRYIDSHHAPIHTKPFLWRKVSRTLKCSVKGPFYLPPTKTSLLKHSNGPSGDHQREEDPRFHLYVKHYTPKPDIFKYVDYHINAIIKRKNDILGIKHE